MYMTDLEYRSPLSLAIINLLTRDTILL